MLPSSSSILKLSNCGLLVVYIASEKHNNATSYASPKQKFKKNSCYYKCCASTEATLNSSKTFDQILNDDRVLRFLFGSTQVVCREQFCYTFDYLHHSLYP